MAKLPGSGIRMASIPVTLQVQPFSPESGNPGSPGGSNPNPGGSSAGGGGAFGAAGLIGLLLLAFGLGGGLLTAPSDEQTAAPPPATITAAEPTVGPLEVPPALRVYLIPQ